MVWLDFDVEPAPDTGTPSVKAHWGAVRWNLHVFHFLKQFHQLHDSCYKMEKMKKKIVNSMHK